MWILQISNDLDIAAAKNVIPSGAAQAQNVFWQVAGEVTVHENAHFAGVILCQTALASRCSS